MMMLMMMMTDCKQNEKGLADFDKQLAQLQTKKELIERRSDEDRAWLENFNANIGPFVQKYEDMKTEVKDIYGNATAFHAKGIEQLKEVFDYNPSFMRWNDSFGPVTAFKPKK